MNAKKVGRREVMRVIGAAGAAALAFGCGGETPTSPSTTSTAGTTGATSTGIASTNAACAVTPTETVGPYPSLIDLFRNDIREGKSGVLLALTVKVVNANSGCAAVPNANVEIWQCDATGNYSQYGSQAAQTYLRGIQTTSPRSTPGGTKVERHTFTSKSPSTGPP
jgi:hypothetical protein